MDYTTLTAAAVDCLTKAFKGEEVPAHVVQAATTVVLTLKAEQRLSESLSREVK